MSRVGRAIGISASLATVAMAAMLFAASSAMAVDWRVTSVHGPTEFAPGGTGQYVVIPYNTAFNVTPPGAPNNATQNGTAGPYTVEDVLPPGVVATGATGSGWNCGATTFPATTVTCTSSTQIHARSASQGLLVNRRGAGRPLFIDVTVDPEASGTADNTVTISGGGALAPATITDPTKIGTDPVEFGVVDGTFSAKAFDARFPAGADVTQAGAHPHEMRVAWDFNLGLTNDPTFGVFTEPVGHVKRIETVLPPGLIGNPEVAAQCPAARLAENVASGPFTACPAASQVGTIDAVAQNINAILGASQQPNLTTDMPLYNMVPGRGEVAAFGYMLQGFPLRIGFSLVPGDGGYVIKATTNAIELLPIRSVRLHVWGVPADPINDLLRFNPVTGSYNTPANLPPRPLLTLPSQCDEDTSTSVRMNDWLDQSNFVEVQSAPEEATGCEKQSFGASVVAETDTGHADSPAGLSFDLSIPQDGSPIGLGTPPLKRAVVTLPQGVSVNPSSAGGLGSCSMEELGISADGTPNGDPVHCPDASKIGTLDLETPLLEKNVKGSVYLAKPFDNPFDSLIALYLVLHDPERGLLVKVPAEVSVDPVTGQITTTVDENPQLPFETLHVELKQGPRAPLRTPDRCGTYTTTAELTSWNSAIPVVRSESSFEVTSGPNGGPCPNGGFDPKLSGGLESPIAGSTSPFHLRFSREDGTQQFSSLKVDLPEGLTAYLKGVSYGEQVGTVQVGAGAGSNPFYVNTGRAILMGPYKGAPLSMLFSVPAVAGPFDLGMVDVRAALHVDPTTARITAVSDPMPTILQGIPLDVRDIRVSIDRPGFTLAPTSCEEMSIDSLVTSTGGATATPSQRFQVGECAALGFKPRLKLNLTGATGRSGNPGFRAELRSRRGDANLGGAEVLLPKSQLIDNAHINNPCTRVQYGAGACPKSSVLGWARAFTPLLDQPLEGPVYFRSNGGERKLPDVVAALDGQFRFDLMIGILQSKTGRLRTKVLNAPDAPVSKFVLRLAGGKKGLIENSQDLCVGKRRAVVRLDGQNGRTYDYKPVMKVKCGKQKKRAR